MSQPLTNAPRSAVPVPAGAAPITPIRLAHTDLPALHHQLDSSVRRYFVDEFFERHVRSIAQGSRVIDVGGIRGKKRGRFNIESFGHVVAYVNQSAAANPDILADAGAIPLPDSTADVVILAEVIEHLRDPAGAIREAARLLVPGGVLLATAPFLFRIHPDPIDVGRYAPDWWSMTLAESGFREVIIERQGSFPSVMAEFIRGWCKHLHDSGSELPPDLPVWTSSPVQFAQLVRESAAAWEAKGSDAYLDSYTTGIGVVART